MANIFWVIFDTCQYTQYYQDVHNLLALPEGATMRYDYKQDLMSDAAIKLAQEKTSHPILFVYAQKAGAYTRVGANSKRPDGILKTVFVATRAGKMLSVTKDAKSYYFDFEVAGYPHQDRQLLGGILNELEENEETPWRKWVSVSTEIGNLTALLSGEEQDNWSAIVDLLGTPPMQFAGDAFWRIKALYADSGARKFPMVEYYSDGDRSRQARSKFEMVENESWRVELLSETAKGLTSSTAAEAPIGEYTVDATTTDAKILTVSGTPVFDLRHYTGQMIEYRAESHPVFGKAIADLVLRTKPQSSQWPSGANIVLRHQLRRNRVRLAFGTATGIIGTVLFTIAGSKSFEASAGATPMKIAGVLLELHP